MTRPKPPPLVAAGVDLRALRWMPLDLSKLYNSETWALARRVPGASRACLNLWARSWHQVPAGSLPASDSLLSQLADVTDWPSVRAIALRGWEECSDGRLYHAVLAREVARAFREVSRHQAEKEADRKRKLAAREQKRLLNQRRRPGGHPTDIPETSHGSPLYDKDKDNRSPLTPKAVAGMAARCLALAGKENNPTWHGGPVHQWLADGCDPERDIFPTIQRLTERDPDAARSLAYFRVAIYEARDARLAAGNGSGDGGVDVSEPWRDVVVSATKAGHRETADKVLAAAMAGDYEKANKLALEYQEAQRK